MAELLSPSAVEAAHARIAPHVRRTPVTMVEGAAFGLAEPVSLKLELLQHTGSFKARGAFNNLIARSVPAVGVTAASGGNHGAAVAYAAACLGHRARIFVPTVASPVKIERIRAYGADVVVEGDRYADAALLCDAHAEASGALKIHPFDSPYTIAGQGTVAREWEEDADGLDTVLVAAGGGGLVAGTALWFSGRVRVIAVEPQGSCALHAARAAGRPVDVEIESIAVDSLGAKRVGDLVHAIATDHVADCLLVPDSAIVEAQMRLWTTLRIAAEPGGATALAALLAGAYVPRPGERVGVLVCGGNVDLAALAALVG
ncbi:threonine/serine dehydratase [Siculibacillus lacustris]|uniref:Threonine/serine dehydratase n=1 Tax=Siculibacillus lacustris TaxID=1549641 RepID=A0A4Q9VUW1_9HYPH|nr:threonine/serine dehydratase [Siculibacillus lacustris]TBW40011.1 threonine/serine dehydratase [Siculibacillus lacustris]